MNTFKINDTKISLEQKPYIIAELSGNHKKSLDRIFDMMKIAKESGASALKIQTLRAEYITVNSQRDEFLINNDKNLWTGRTLYDLYKESELPWEWHSEVFKKAKELDIDCFSSPFDLEAVGFLLDLGVPAFKIASFEITDEPLVIEIARTGKPIIASTGMASLDEVDRLVELLNKYGSGSFALLKCTSNYPADPRESNLLTIKDLKNRYGCEVGLSDHTLGIGVACCSIAMGASIIEKHFTLSRDDGGIDSKFSLTPSELKSLVEETTRSWQALGKINYGPTESEKDSLLYRRSLYAIDDIKEGDIISSNNIRSVRPNLGIKTKYYNRILGQKAKTNIKKGTPLEKEFFDL